MFDKINWKVRLQNKAWVVAFIASLFVLAGAICNMFNIKIDLDLIQGNVVQVVYALFGVLTVLGVISDPTTKTLLEDGPLGLSYTTPSGWDDEDIDDDEEDGDEDEADFQDDDMKEKDDEE